MLTSSFRTNQRNKDCQAKIQKVRMQVATMVSLTLLRRHLRSLKSRLGTTLRRWSCGRATYSFIKTTSRTWSQKVRRWWSSYLRGRSRMLESIWSPHKYGSSTSTLKRRISIWDSAFCSASQRSRLRSSRSKRSTKSKCVRYWLTTL